MATATAESQLLPGSDRGVGSLPAPSTGNEVIPESIQPIAPPVMCEYNNLYSIQVDSTVHRLPEAPSSTPTAPSTAPRTTPPKPHPTMVARRRTQKRTPAISFRTIMKPAYECTFPLCNKQYGRIADLRRHYQGAHEGLKLFKCRYAGCKRAVEGFSRKDKRRDHERIMHEWRADRGVEEVFFE